jgi:hypothetical protein
MQNISELEVHHSKRGTDGGNCEEGAKCSGGILIPYILTGWPPTCVLMMVNEARRYLATSVQLQLQEYPKNKIYYNRPNPLHNYIRFKAFMVTECSEVFSGSQPRKY